MERKRAAESLKKMVLISLTVFYLTSSISLWIYVRTLSKIALSLGRWAASLGLLLHAAVLIAALADNSSFVPANPHESHLLSTFITGFAAWLMALNRSTTPVSIVLFPVVLAVFGAFRFYVPSSVMAPLPSPWLWVHILLMIFGEAMFFVSAGMSIVYLAADSQIRRKNFSGIITKITSLSDFDQRLSKILGIGFFLLSLGMMMGFFFAKSFWAPGWWWDPKVLFCFVTWVLYGLLIVLRQIYPPLRGRRSAWIAFLGFLGVLFLAWGVEHFFESQHQNYQLESGDSH